VRAYRVEVVRRVPHPGRGYTQGLIAEPDGSVIESTGLYGQSELRRYRLGAREATDRSGLPAGLFGEGICQVGDVIWQLTWKERKALRWDADTLALREVIAYNRTGGGICAADDAGADGVITSDGTSELVRRDPKTLAPRELIKVRCEGNRVPGLNDLAWSAGRAWANVAPTRALVGIDLATGEVTDVVDASAAADGFQLDPEAIMNGIAALPGEGEFLLTGKRWRAIRHVRLVPARGRAMTARLLRDAGRY
jgi:glutamine cyclotransferase